MVHLNERLFHAQPLIYTNINSYLEIPSKHYGLQDTRGFKSDTAKVSKPNDQQRHSDSLESRLQDENVTLNSELTK